MKDSNINNQYYNNQNYNGLVDRSLLQKKIRTCNLLMLLELIFKTI